MKSALSTLIKYLFDRETFIIRIQCCVLEVPRFTSGTASSGGSGYIQIATGSATHGEGGDILVSIGKSKTDTGGDVVITAGHSFPKTGGAVSIATGEGSTDSPHIDC